MSAKNKRAHLNDYQLTDDGTYEYRGTVWRWKDKGKRPALLKEAWALLAGVGGCLIVAGFVPPVGVGSTFFVLLPYAAAAVGAALSTAALWRLTHEGTDIRDHIYHTSVEGLTPRLTLCLVASVACAVGQSLCALFHMGEVTSPLWSAAYLGCMLGSALCAGLLLKRVQRLSFTEIRR